MFKKLYLILAFVFAFQYFAFSQRSKEFGLRFSANSPWLINQNLYSDDGIDYGFSYGYSAGLKAGIDVYYEFGVNAEILFTHYASAFYENKVDPHWSRSFSLNYIEMPIMLRYKEDKFYFEAGPQLGFLLNAQSVQTHLGDKDEIRSDKILYNPLNYALVLGSGFMVYEHEHYNIFLGGRMSYGFNNVFNEDNINPTKVYYPYSIFPNYPLSYNPDYAVQNLPVHTFYVGFCAELSWGNIRHR